MENKSILYIPSLKTEVVIEFFDSPFRFKIEYLPNNKYSDNIIKNEVKKIIKEMLKHINKELK